MCLGPGDSILLTSIFTTIACSLEAPHTPSQDRWGEDSPCIVPPSHSNTFLGTFLGTHPPPSPLTGGFLSSSFQVLLVPLCSLCCPPSSGPHWNLFPRRVLRSGMDSSSS